VTDITLKPLDVAIDPVEALGRRCLLLFISMG
jgi:hypothetical protein